MPDIQYLRECKSHVESYWSLEIAKDRTRRDEYWDEALVDVPATEDKKRRRRIKPERMNLSEVRRIVDLIKSFYPYPAQIGVQHTGTGELSVSRADRVTRGLNEAIDQLNPPTDSPLLRDRFNQCLFGRTVDLIVPGDQYWMGTPLRNNGESLDDWWERYSNWKRKAPIPVAWIDLKPESTFPPSFGSLDEEVISWMTVSCRDLQRMFSTEEISESGLRDLEKKKWSDEVDLYIYSDREYLCYGVSGGSKGILGGRQEGMLRTIEHGLGTPAIRIVPGQTTGFKEPGRYWVGVADSAIGVIRSLNKRASEAATASKFDAFPILKWRRQRQVMDEGATAENALWLEGDVWELNAGDEMNKDEDIGPVFQPQFGDKTLNLVQFLLNRSERLSGARESLEGGSGPSGEPAWSRNAIIEQAKDRLSELSSNIAGADVDAAERIRNALVVFGEEVPLSPKGSDVDLVLKPSELKEYKAILGADIRMKLGINDRADLDLIVRTWQACVEAGVPISWPTLAKRISIGQPYDELKGFIQWRLLTSPEMIAYYTKKLIQEAEMDDDEGMGIEELQSLVDSGQLPPEVALMLGQQATGGNGSAPGQGAGGLAQGIVQAGGAFQRSPGGPGPESGYLA